MARFGKANKYRLLRKRHCNLRESSSEDELQNFFSGDRKSTDNHGSTGSDATQSEDKKVQFLVQNDKEKDSGIEESEFEEKEITPVIYEAREQLKENREQSLVSVKQTGVVLSAEQMEHLANSDYEYNAMAGSVLEKFCMQRFWCWATTFVPLSVMPCTITAIGFLLNLITSSILIYYSPTATEPVPAWTLYLAAAGVFLYQTADALDGKQCYKIQNSHIEEFYDHACDSVSTILLMYSVAISTQVGNYPNLLVTLVYVSLLAFWSTHWQCYITKQMIFGYVDVTEAQFVMIVTHLFSAMFGQQIWATELSLDFGTLGFDSLKLSLTLSEILAGATLATLFRSIWINCRIVLSGVRTPLESIEALSCPERRRDTVRPLLPIVALTFLLTVNWLLLCHQERQHHRQEQHERDLLLSSVHSLPSLPTLFTYQQQQHEQYQQQQHRSLPTFDDTFHLVTFVLTFGTAMAKLTMRLVLAHCTEVDAPTVDVSLLPLTIQFIVLNISRLPVFYHHLPTPIGVYLNYLPVVTLFVNCLILGHFFVGVGIDMEKALGVKVFTLVYPPGHPKNRTSHKGIYINGLNNQQMLKQARARQLIN